MKNPSRGKQAKIIRKDDEVKEDHGRGQREVIIREKWEETSLGCLMKGCSQGGM